MYILTTVFIVLFILWIYFLTIYILNFIIFSFYSKKEKLKLLEMKENFDWYQIFYYSPVLYRFQSLLAIVLNFILLLLIFNTWRLL